MPTTYTDLDRRRPQGARRRSPSRSSSAASTPRRRCSSLDVREKDECRAGFIPGAISHPARLPRDPGRAEAPRQERARSSPTAPAARARRSPRRRSPSSATPTSRRPTPASCAGRTSATRSRRRRSSPTRSATATRATSSCPRWARSGRRSSSRARCCSSARAGSARPRRSTSRRRAWARSASSTPTSSTRRTCSGRSSTRRAASGTPKVESAAKAIADLNPDVKVVGHKERLTSANVERIFARLRGRRRRDRQLPHALPRQRRVACSSASPSCTGRIFRFDGQVTTFIPEKAAKKLGVAAGPCYRCLYPEPPPPHLAPSCQEAGVLGILLRDHRDPAGDRGDQDSSSARATHARRPPAHLRQPEDEVPRAPAAPRPGLPGVRHRSRPSRATSTTKGSARSG